MGTILHGDDRFYNNIFQKWPAAPFTVIHDSDDGQDEENREVGTHVMDEYPTYEEWIAQFDMDTDTPDMAKLACPRRPPASLGGGQRLFRRRQSLQKRD